MTLRDTLAEQGIGGVANELRLIQSMESPSCDPMWRGRQLLIDTLTFHSGHVGGSRACIRELRNVADWLRHHALLIEDDLEQDEEADQ